jgi:uncharacterized membrane protein
MTILITIKQIVIALVFMLALDYVWLSVIAKDFYVNNLKPVLRIGTEGKMDPVIFSAILVYVAIAIGIIYFVIPKAGGSAISALWIGAIFGLVTYAVYEFTNHALLTNWSIKVVVVDLLWGAILCGTTSYLLVKLFS